MLRHARFSGKASRLPALATDCVRQHRDLPGGIDSIELYFGGREKSICFYAVFRIRPTERDHTLASGGNCIKTGLS
jgi:hypothetical protein